LQLGAAVASLTLVRVLHVEGLLGLGPAIVLASGALVALPVGLLMDRFGRVPVLMAGFGSGIAGCLLSALWVTGVVAVGVALFALGLGWNFSFVAATAVLSDSTEASARGKLLGFNDLLAGLTGAGLALLGGLALPALGVASLAIGGAARVAAPALWILRNGAAPRAAVRA